MKLKFQNQNNLPIFSLILFALMFGFTACNEDSNDDTSIIANEEAAAIVESALFSGTAGIADEVSDATLVALEYTEKGLTGGDCGETFDSTITRSIDEPRVAADYITSWIWTVNCNNLMVPTSLDFARNTSGEYETMRLVSDDNSSSDWTIGNLITGATWTLNGTYSRSGNQTSKVRNQNSFTSELEMTLASLNVNKNTLQIDGGTGTFSLTGSVTGGGSFSYAGSITFLGNGMATITINGETYEIDLN